MRFVNSISELSYYTTQLNAPCYCEQLTFASDLTLQSVLQTNATSGFTFQVDVYSADGLTNYENGSAYFSFLPFLNPITGRKAFNMRLNAFSPAMCSYKCWILRVRVYVSGALIFDKYTDRYCQSECCEIPRNISISQNGISGPEEFLTYEPTDQDNAGDIGTPQGPTTDVTSSAGYGVCGVPLIRITVNWPCYDAKTGFYYGTPTTVYNATAPFSLAFVLNIPGRIVDRPASINREISFNCRTQRSESFSPYLLEGRSEASLVPAWKMREIEGAFHAPEIMIDGLPYQWNGGTLFTQPTNCLEVFKLQTTMQSCVSRQDFGCQDPCQATRTSDYVVPGSYRGSGFYDETREPFADLYDYFANRANVTEVEDVTSEYAEAAEAYRVTSFGQTPTYFYYDEPRNANRVFAADPGVVSAVIACAMPLTGTITFADETCDTPTIGTISFTDAEIMTVAIRFANGWVEAGSSRGEVYGNEVRLFIQAYNPAFPVDPADGTANYFDSDVVGYIEAPARPVVGRIVYVNETFSLFIATNGVITVTGTPTRPDESYSYIFANGTPYALND